MFDFLDDYIFESETGNLYEYTGSTGKQAVFSDINSGDPLFLKISEIGAYFVDIHRR